MSLIAIPGLAGIPSCTWQHCSGPGAYIQLDKTGKEWTRLCGYHDAALDEAVSSGDVGRVLAAWVKASGGPKTLAASM